MAKGLQQRRGKVGNEIYYNIANSNNKEKQGVRVYQPNVKNPKSVAQSIQRMKTAPSVAFYRALAELLDHSWQGIPYGGRSTQYFRKQAMLMKSGFPYVVKGDATPYPGQYPLSSGSLVSPVISGFNEGTHSLVTNIKVADREIFLSGQGQTIGIVSQELIQNNAYLKEGDQLTFVYCLPVSEAGGIASVDLTQGVYYKYCRLILNTESEYLWDDWTKAAGFVLTASGENNDFNVHFSGAGSTYPPKDVLPCGGAIILSRPPRSEGAAWQRSLTRFYCTPEYLAVMMSDAAYQAALSSYQKEDATISSDWYLNQGAEYDEQTSLGETFVSSGNVTINGTNFAGAFFNRRGTAKLIVGPLESGSRVVYRYVDATTVATQGTFTQTAVEAAVGTNYTLFTTAKNYIPALAINESGGDERP